MATEHHATGISQESPRTEHGRQESLPPRGRGRAAASSRTRNAASSNADEDPLEGGVLRDDITRGDQVDNPGKTPGTAEGDEDSVDANL